jgi:hypothetical protein
MNKKYEKGPVKCSLCYFCHNINGTPFCRANPPQVVQAMGCAPSSQIITEMPIHRFDCMFPPCPPDDLGCGKFYPREWGERDQKIVESDKSDA